MKTPTATDLAIFRPGTNLTTGDHIFTEIVLAADVGRDFVENAGEVLDRTWYHIPMLSVVEWLIVGKYSGKPLSSKI